MWSRFGLGLLTLAALYGGFCAWGSYQAAVRPVAAATSAYQRILTDLDNAILDLDPGGESSESPTLRRYRAAVWLQDSLVAWEQLQSLAWGRGLDVAPLSARLQDMWFVVHGTLGRELAGEGVDTSRLDQARQMLIELRTGLPPAEDDWAGRLAAWAKGQR